MPRYWRNIFLFIFSQNCSPAQEQGVREYRVNFGIEISDSFNMMLECNNTKDYRLKLLRCKICLSFFNLHVFFWNCATDVATSFLCNILLEQTRRRKMWRPSRGLRIEVAVPLVKGLGVVALTPFVVMRKSDGNILPCIPS